MAITYNAGTNTITITGYTEAVPCNFCLDSYNADVAGGWGVVSRLCTDQYCFNCLVDIGDGVNATWVADTYKNIIYPLNAHWIKVLANAHFRLGEVVDAAKRTSKDGCSIINLSTDKQWLEFTGTGIVEIYSSLISTPNRAKLYSNNATGSGSKIWNTTVMRMYVSNTGVIPDFDVFRINWQSDGGAGSKLVGTINDLRITDCTNALVFMSNIADVTIKNCVVVNESSSTFYILLTSVNFYFINFECAWTFSWMIATSTIIYRQYELNLKVIDKDNTPINSATVKIWDKDGNLVVDTTTDANGVVTTQTITRGTYNQANGNTLQEKSPHLIKIEKSGYTTYEADFTLEEKTKWLIALQVGGGGGLMRNPPMTGGMV